MSPGTIFRNIGQLLSMVSTGGEGDEDLLGVIHAAAMVVKGGQVTWIGAEADLPKSEAEGLGAVDLGGRVVMPGLVECHTHLVFAGSRSREFGLRVQGVSYEEIGRQGGGILSTVKASRAASRESLLELATERLDGFLSLGVTTLEAKSGYGLELTSELKLLEVAREAGERHPVDVISTFLGAHTLPLEARSHREAYVRQVVEEMIPEVVNQGLATFCDVFCETGAFTLKEAREVLEAGLSHGLRAKIHAEQRTSTGATLLAAELGAVSADHLDLCTSEDVTALADSGTVPVLLPAATFYLGGVARPRASLFLEQGVEVAVSTDFNPGSAPTRNLWLSGTMACVGLGLSPARALRGMTIVAARALGMEETRGHLGVGAEADFLVLRPGHFEEILYSFGENPVWRVFKRGLLVHG